MKRLFFAIMAVTFLAVLFNAGAFGQDAEDGAASIGKPEDKTNTPKGFKDQLVKMKIEREKKDFQEMIDRGEEAAKLSDQVERAFASRGNLTDEDKQKIDSVEKLVKKIRSELGGSDDNDSDDDAQKADKPPKDVVSGVKYLRDSTAKLLDQLKQTSRFTISAAAIQYSNSVLKIARFLRFGN
ncbi:MAG: hypothetical protein ACRD43_12330 [Pyrinomonadaceae bacterium]